ncbi:MULTISPECIES: PEP/pyruvate-binding domain-containing protein [unclassified Fusibacter]|uniref:PEP/pyruvate-binding domain-containing protein n=1 Tax=unclassified Fusibacter TaxID=2624464 RepID=UPI001010E637|nr:MULTISPECIES: PEP/pyruvate-binding domain-containing protein [unclassified Fusibacter]MCK8061162.1 hypothetical protein [Fusibacter sp. A2]NPE23301.1 hypothetical protein [Fusibacter sp. A1]RXV59343.1 hypothetical protein DWB64_15885 [Fusibacter sp. A1]
MIWLSEVDDRHIQLVGKDLVEIGQLTKMEVDVAKGFIVSTSVYHKFMERNKISDVIFDVVQSLESDLASKTIASHFSNSKYSTDEINSLMTFYQKLEKPVTIWGQMIDVSTGDPVETVQPITVTDIADFRVFSDTVIKTWQNIWGMEQVNAIRHDRESYEDLSVVLMVQEQKGSKVLSKTESFSPDFLNLPPTMIVENKERPTFSNFMQSLSKFFLGR